MLNLYAEKNNVLVENVENPKWKENYDILKIDYKMVKLWMWKWNQW